MDYSILINLIPPAVAIGILAYFTRFFGKVIADQKPFTDSRDWEIEIGGVMFMIIISQGIVGVAAAFYGPNLNSFLTHTFSLFAVTFLYLFLSLARGALSRKFFQINIGAIEKTLEEKGLAEFFYKVSKKLPIGLVSIILFYVATIEYMTGSIIWMILIWPSIFFLFVILASIYSMRRDERIGVDIYFIDESKPPLKNMLVLKVNEDNLRVRDGDVVYILNKNQVLKIVQVVPEKHLLVKDK